VAFDGANIWVTNQVDNTVSKLRASDGINLGTFATGTDPIDLAFDGNNIWVTNALDNTVSILRELAEMASIGISALYHHLRALIAMSPLQYQKQLRLAAAESGC